jgi:beta-glucosidase
VGKPTVVVLQHGRALALTGSLRRAHAILAGWYLGCESGHALADVLLGDYNPSARLPVSFPQASGQQPYFYNHRSTGRPQVRADEAQFKTRYRDITHEALYPFGFGLSYSPVSYSATDISAAQLPWNGSLEVSVTIQNLGKRAVREVAQLYIHQRVGTLTRPVRELRGFQGVHIEPGQSATVRFKLTRHDLAYAGPDGAPLIEPGWFEVFVAPNAAAGAPRAMRLLPPA